jgi:hypothetical protein
MQKASTMVVTHGNRTPTACPAASFFEAHLVKEACTICFVISGIIWSIWGHKTCGVLCLQPFCSTVLLISKHADMLPSYTVLPCPLLNASYGVIFCSAAAAIADASKHALVKDAWEFLHDEGHINQGVLEGEPPRTTACEPYLHCTHTHMLHCMAKSHDSCNLMCKVTPVATKSVALWMLCKLDLHVAGTFQGCLCNTFWALLVLTGW